MKYYFFTHISSLLLCSLHSPYNGVHSVFVQSSLNETSDTVYSQDSRKSEHRKRKLPKINIGKDSDSPSSNPFTTLPPSPSFYKYDLDHPLGPDHWNLVDTSNNEWLKYVETELSDDSDVKAEHNLKRVTENTCNDHIQESPINLVRIDELCTATHEMLKPTREHPCGFSDFEFKLESFGLRAYAPLDDMKCDRPRLDLPNGFPFGWIMNHIEIKMRSEHLLGGRRYDGEMVMAFLGTKQHNRMVAFVSILLDSTSQYYPDNPKLGAYINQWEKAHDAILRKCSSNPIDEKKIYTNHNYPYGERGKQGFPYDIWPTEQFYRYRGSITTPPCTSMVNWRILDKPLKISRKQYKRLANLINNALSSETCNRITSASSKGEVNRPLQYFDYEHQDINHCTTANF